MHQKTYHFNKDNLLAFQSVVGWLWRCVSVCCCSPSSVCSQKRSDANCDPRVRKKRFILAAMLPTEQLWPLRQNKKMVQGCFGVNKKLQGTYGGETGTDCGAVSKLTWLLAHQVYNRVNIHCCVMFHGGCSLTQSEVCCLKSLSVLCFRGAQVWTCTVAPMSTNIRGCLALYLFWRSWPGWNYLEMLEQSDEPHHSLLQRMLRWARGHRPQELQ